MALSKTVFTDHGFEAINAYHRVEAVLIVGKDTINFYLRSYKEVDKPCFAEQLLSAAYDLSGENPLKQAYEHVKTLSQFIDALDC
jgi:hypothetical protein